MHLKNKATGPEIMQEHKRASKTTTEGDFFALYQIFPARPQE